MSAPLRQMFVIARRDFLSIVATPTFLLFLLAPLFMLGFGLVGGLGAASMGQSAEEDAGMIAVVAAADRTDIVAADARLRSRYTDEGMPPPIDIVVAGEDPATQARDLANSGEKDVYAVLYGPLDNPVILERNKGARSGRYLATLAETATQVQRDGEFRSLSTPQFERLGRASAQNSTRQGIGFFAVFAIFIMTLFTASQTVSTLAEEKSNKVIEILAASTPLEAVFAGKLIAMLGVAILFIGFWLVLGFGGSLFFALQYGDQAMAAASAAQAASAAPLDIAQFAPAIGFPVFITLVVVYFLLSFLLLGSVFLSIGGLASTMREIQMLSLPITIFMVAMFGLGAAAASAPESPLATFAQIFPFSSPFAMAARGATDAAVLPHLLAIGWQMLWVGLVIWAGVRLFRYGVLRSGPLFGRSGKRS